MFTLLQGILWQACNCNFPPKCKILIYLIYLLSELYIHRVTITMLLTICLGEGFKLTNKIGKLSRFQLFSAHIQVYKTIHTKFQKYNLVHG